MIYITGPQGNRQVLSGVPYKLGPGEQITGGTVNERDNALDIAVKGTRTGVGDLINAVTKSTGFKSWWKKLHKGECLPCKKRQATLNYLKFQGPEWLSNWVKEHKDKGEK